mmetsp:Transcript_31218/g.80237  ORF Transcript_31218/g.80237 Transcript_31218/m.80237 type:complete len:180 (+) Transcript_31218:79-618(+)
MAGAVQAALETRLDALTTEMLELLPRVSPGHRLRIMARLAGHGQEPLGAAPAPAGDGGFMADVKDVLGSLAAAHAPCPGGSFIGSFIVVNNIHVNKDRQNGIQLQSDMAGAFKGNNDAVSGTGNVQRQNGVQLQTDFAGAFQGNNNAVSGTGDVARQNGVIATSETQQFGTDVSGGPAA